MRDIQWTGYLVWTGPALSPRGPHMSDDEFFDALERFAEHQTASILAGDRALELNGESR